MSDDPLADALRAGGRRSFSLHLQVAEGLRVVTTPLPVADYAGRPGYDPLFVDPATPVPLPAVGAWADDLAEVDEEARDPLDPHVLRYQHFSVKVSKSRRMPLFSAVNVDGVNEQGDIARTDVWRFDPRIPVRFQILKECYGRQDLGYFSRGHMTRREDPNWGTLEEATLADADTFRATNACPQVQRFNEGVWLRIEDYVLRNANRDNMRVSVMTGPVFADADREIFGVRVPATFWKIVVFVHDVTREVTATGYTASQASLLPDAVEPMPDPR